MWRRPVAFYIHRTQISPKTSVRAETVLLRKEASGRELRNAAKPTREAALSKKLRLRFLDFLLDFLGTACIDANDHDSEPGVTL